MKKILLIALGLIPLASYATLGENSNSIANDNKALASNSSMIVTKSLTATNANQSESGNYQVSTIVTPDGVKIYEYTANNKVFAISWVGTLPPDLNQLLGTYFSQFKSTKPTSKSMTGATVNNGTVVVKTFGVIGNYHGLAYIPAMVPPYVKINELMK